MKYEDALLETSDNRWQHLNTDQRVEVLQTIEYHLAKEQGRTPVHVEAQNLFPRIPGEIRFGAYHHASQTMYFNKLNWNSGGIEQKCATNALDTLCHEGRHAYQHQAMDGAIIHDNPREVLDWLENNKPGHYISSPALDAEGYRKQPLEKDAFCFGQQRMLKLLEERETLRQARCFQPEEFYSATRAKGMDQSLQNPEQNRSLHL